MSLKNLEKCILNAYNTIIKDYEILIINREFDFEYLKDLFKQGIIVVRDDNSDTSIFSRNKYNIMFRVWHDYLHFKNNYDFTLKGEIETYKEHIKVQGLSEYDKRVLRIEIVYQTVSYLTTGNFPKDQTSFFQKYIILNG